MLLPEKLVADGIVIHGVAQPPPEFGGGFLEGQLGPVDHVGERQGIIVDDVDAELHNGREPYAFGVLQTPGGLIPCLKALQYLLFIGVDGQNAEVVGKQPSHAFMGREIRHDAVVKAAQHFVARLAAEFLVQQLEFFHVEVDEGILGLARRLDEFRGQLVEAFDGVAAGDGVHVGDLFELMLVAGIGQHLIRHEHGESQRDGGAQQQGGPHEQFGLGVHHLHRDEPHQIPLRIPQRGIGHVYPPAFLVAVGHHAGIAHAHVGLDLWKGHPILHHDRGKGTQKVVAGLGRVL